MKVKPSDEAWKKFLIRHWEMTILFIVLIAVAAAVAIFVFLSLVAGLQATGTVPIVLGDWTVGYLITFIISLIIWELVFVGIWVIPIVLIIYFQWYKKLPAKEQKEYGGRPRRKVREGGGFSCFVALIWLVVVWFDGRWNLAFQSWTFDNWAYSWLAACLWALLIAGIFGSMYVVWSLNKGSRKR